MCDTHANIGGSCRLQKYNTKVHGVAGLKLIAVLRQLGYHRRSGFLYGQCRAWLSLLDRG